MVTGNADNPQGSDRILAIAERLADDGEAQATAKERRQAWISFLLAGRPFALPVSHVRGVHRAGHVTPLPGAPPAVRGLTNLRGRVIAVVDLAAHLDLGTTEIDEGSRILDAELGRRRVGLLTERTDSLIKVRPSEIEPMNGDGGAAAITGRAAGEIETRSGRVILLDPKQILEEAAVTPAGAAAVRRKER